MSWLQGSIFAGPYNVNGENAPNPDAAMPKTCWEQGVPDVGQANGGGAQNNRREEAGNEGGGQDAEY